MRDDRDEVELPAYQRPQDGSEDDIAHVPCLHLVAALPQLPLRHYLRDHERQKHGDPEPGQLELKGAEVNRDVERMDDGWLAAHASKDTRSGLLRLDLDSHGRNVGQVRLELTIQRGPPLAPHCSNRRLVVTAPVRG